MSTKYIATRSVAKKVKTDGKEYFFSNTEGYKTSFLGFIAIAGVAFLETISLAVLVEGLVDMGISRISKVARK